MFNFTSTGRLSRKSTFHIMCVRVYAPPTLATPSRESKIEQGWPGSPLAPSEGHLDWRMGLPALLGGNLGYWIVSTYIAQSLGYVINRIHHGLKVVFYFWQFTVLHYHHYARLLYGVVCVQLAYSSKVIERIYLYLMFFSSSHRKYPPFPLFSYFSVVVCLRCSLHHILSVIVYTFRENRENVFNSIVQFMMSANCRIRFDLQIVFVCLYIAPSHYHHCANFIWRHWTYKMPVRYNLSSVWVRLSIFS